MTEAVRAERNSGVIVGTGRTQACRAGRAAHQRQTSPRREASANRRAFRYSRVAGGARSQMSAAVAFGVGGTRCRRALRCGAGAAPVEREHRSGEMLPRKATGFAISGERPAREPWRCKRRPEKNLIDPMQRQRRGFRLRLLSASHAVSRLSAAVRILATESSSQAGIIAHLFIRIRVQRRYGGPSFAGVQELRFGNKTDVAGM